MLFCPFGVNVKFSGFGCNQLLGALWLVVAKLIAKVVLLGPNQATMSMLTYGST